MNKLSWYIYFLIFIKKKINTPDDCWCDKNNFLDREIIIVIMKEHFAEASLRISL